MVAVPRVHHQPVTVILNDILFLKELRIWEMFCSILCLHFSNSTYISLLMAITFYRVTDPDVCIFIFLISYAQSFRSCSMIPEVLIYRTTGVEEKVTNLLFIADESILSFLRKYRINRCTSLNVLSIKGIEGLLPNTSPTTLP